MGAFFGLIHGTFNHLLLSDRVWLARFGMGAPPDIKSLADELFPDFDELRRERAATDAVIDDYVAALRPEQLAATLAYRTVRGTPSLTRSASCSLTGSITRRTTVDRPPRCSCSSVATPASPTPWCS